MFKSYWSRYILLVCLSKSVVANADESSSETDNTTETITVYGNKIPTVRETITTSISIYDKDDIEEQQADDIRELLSNLPGVSVPYQGSRFGLSGVSIRGIGGNRVAIEVDGAPVSSSFSIGSFSNASRDFFDLGLTKTLTLVKGPSSVMFGSDALGGVVAISTIDPEDIFKEEDFAINLRTGYASSDERQAGRVTSAVDLENQSVLASLSLMSQSDWDTFDDSERDEYENDNFSVFLKHIYGKANQGGLKSSIYWSEDNSETALDSGEGVADFSEGFGTTYIIRTEDLRADDEKSQKRLTFEQFWQEGLLNFDTLRWQAYYQEFLTEQETFENRSLETVLGIEPTLRQRVSTFDQTIFGLKTSASHNIGQHVIFYGFEYENTETEQLRDGFAQSLTSGDVTNVVGPDAFPVRDFPVSETENTSAFLQFQSYWFDKRLAIIPGVRYENYNLTPKVDDIFAEDNPGVESVEIDESETSASMGVTLKLIEELNFFAQYAEGFRAPPSNSVNVGFTNFQFGYTAIANPDLESETSQGFEAGLRWESQDAFATLAFFKNDYEDFIDDFVAVGFALLPGSDLPLLVFQSQNLSEVETKGVELQIGYDVDKFIKGLSVGLSAAYIEGSLRDDLTLETVPLNSIEPTKISTYISYRPLETWGINLSIRHAQEKEDIFNTDPTQTPFVPDAYTVANLTGKYQYNKHLALSVGMFNLTDEEYFEWTDVRGRFEGDANLQQLLNPGRSFRFSVNLDF